MKIKNLAVIPAKGHSSRLPRKNVRNFFGKPMFMHSVDTARESGLFDMIAVSTDDEFTATLANKAGCHVINRPPELCEKDGAPDCGTQEVARHALTTLLQESYEIESVCCIYATAPLMIEQDLVGAYAYLWKTKAAYVYATDNEGHDAGQFYWGHALSFHARLPLNYGALWTIAPSRVCDINTVHDYYRAIGLYRDMVADGLKAA